MTMNKENTPIKILVADDHPSTVESIIRYVNNSEDFEIICKVETIRDVFYQLQSQNFDVIILGRITV